MARSGERAALSRWTRSLGGLRTHAPSLLVFAAGSALSLAAFSFLKGRSQDRERAAFHADAAPVVANLRSAFELPLEVLGATAALFEASSGVTRSEFARFVKPALERHPGIRALEWIPVVLHAERARYEQRRATMGSRATSFASATLRARWCAPKPATSTCPSTSWNRATRWCSASTATRSRSAVPPRFVLGRAVARSPRSASS